MGNRAWKKAFSHLYQPPAPQRKGAFLERLEPPGLSTGEFLFSQLFYLRPWNWLLAAAIFVAGLFLMKNQLPQQIRLVSALLPFAALSTVTELHRSARCRMEELEMASRFSLKTLLLARLTLLGLGNLLLLCALFPPDDRVGPAAPGRNRILSFVPLLPHLSALPDDHPPVPGE